MAVFDGRDGNGYQPLSGRGPSSPPKSDETPNQGSSGKRVERSTAAEEDNVKMEVTVNEDWLRSIVRGEIEKKFREITDDETELKQIASDYLTQNAADESDDETPNADDYRRAIGVPCK